MARDILSDKDFNNNAIINANIDADNNTITNLDAADIGPGTFQTGTYVLNGQITIDNLRINENSITNISSGDDIELFPTGTGNVILGVYTFDADQSVGAGQDNYVLTYDNTSGLISLEAVPGGGGGLSIGDAITGGTSGRLLYQDASTQLGTPTLYWDETNKRLGLNEPTAIASLDITAQAASREYILRGRVSDASSSGSIGVGNGTATSSSFAPTWYSATSASVNAMNFQGLVTSANDTGTPNKACIIFSARRTNSVTDPLNGAYSAIQAYDIVRFANYSTVHASMDFEGNFKAENTDGYWQMPVGTTAQRDENGSGSFRYNSSDSKFEVYNGSSWDQMGAVSLSIGDAISGGGANRVLFEDGSNQLANSANFTYDDGTGLLQVTEIQTDLYYIGASANNTYIGISGSNLDIVYESSQAIRINETASSLNIELNGSVGSYGASTPGQGVLRLNDVHTAPVGTLTSGGLIYVDGVELHYLADDGVGTELTKANVRDKSITIESPTSSEDIGIWRTGDDITISRIVAVSVGTSPSVTYTIRHASDRSATGAEVVTGGSTTTSTTTGDSVTVFNDATIPSGSWIWLETTAQSGTVTQTTINIEYTYD